MVRQNSEIIGIQMHNLGLSESFSDNLQHKNWVLHKQLLEKIYNWTKQHKLKFVSGL